jgi:wobble nucleotide-excising tRNase
MSTRLRAAALIAATFVVSTALRAQTGPAKPEEKVLPTEREARARRTIDGMKTLNAQVDKLAAQARSEKDIVKLNCVNEKLNQVRGLLKVSEQAEADLREANARREDEQSLHAFAKVGIAGKKVSQLRQDAEQCIGQLAFYNDEKTQVDVEIPPGLPSDDPTAAPLATTVINRPSPASGF